MEFLHLLFSYEFTRTTGSAAREMVLDEGRSGLGLDVALAIYDCTLEYKRVEFHTMVLMPVQLVVHQTFVIFVYMCDAEVDDLFGLF